MDLIVLNIEMIAVLCLLAFTIFLFKIGIIIPMFTSNTEAFVYISYFTWFLSGLLINITSRHEAGKNAQISMQTILK